MLEQYVSRCPDPALPPAIDFAAPSPGAAMDLLAEPSPTDLLAEPSPVDLLAEPSPTDLLAA